MNKFTRFKYKPIWDDSLIKIVGYQCHECGFIYKKFSEYDCNLCYHFESDTDFMVYDTTDLVKNDKEIE